MLKGRGAWRLGLLLLLALLAWGLAQLFALRQAGGDVYAPYSTLRADPLGAKAFRDALSELPGLRVSRSFQPLDRLHLEGPTTLLYLSVGEEGSWEPGELSALEALLAQGGRLILAFSPQRWQVSPPATPVSKAKTKVEAKTATPVPKPAAAATPGKMKSVKEAQEDLEQRLGVPQPVSLRESLQKWGATLEVAAKAGGGPFSTPARATPAGAPLEPTLSWHSALFFNEESPAWETLYLAEGRPAIIERKVGPGSIVLLADCYLFSNEALHGADRPPKLLSWVLGEPREIVFDEEHFGMVESPGVVTLLRKYRLPWLLGALAMLAALYIWQQGLRFVPPAEDPEVPGAAVAGRGAVEGLHSVLRRSLPPGQLLETCLREWQPTANEAERQRVAGAWQELAPKARRAVASAYTRLVHAARRPR